VITETQKMDATINIVVSVDGQVMQEGPQPMTREEERETTILAVDDDAATKIKVSFPVARGAQGGMPMNEPVQGKTYIVDDSGAMLAVTSESGGAVSALESDFLTNEFDDLSDPDEFVELLNGKSLEAGQTVEVDAETARDLFNDETMTVEKFTLTFTGEQGRSGTRRVSHHGRHRRIHQHAPVLSRLARPQGNDGHRRRASAGRPNRDRRGRRPADDVDEGLL
jgi:hypothetical protein